MQHSCHRSRRQRTRFHRFSDRRIQYTGFQYAVAQGNAVVIQRDADGPHPTKDFESLVNHANLHSSHLVMRSRSRCDEETPQVSRPRKPAMKMHPRVEKRAKHDQATNTPSFSQPLPGQITYMLSHYYPGDKFEALNFATSNDYSVSQISILF